MEQNKLCDYGCGRPALHEFGNGKWCCEDNVGKCSKNREINSEKHKGIKTIGFKNKHHTKNSKLKLSKSLLGKNLGKYKGISKTNNGTFKKGVVPWNKGKKNCQIIWNKGKQNCQLAWNKGLTKDSDERVLKYSESRRKSMLTNFELREKMRQNCLNGHAIIMLKAIKKISKQEIKLRDMVKELYPEADPQHKVLNYAVDIVLIDRKIAIEFDGYFHFDSEEHKQYHKIRQEKIESEGWKFLRYTMYDKFPSLEQLKEDIKERIKNG